MEKKKENKDAKMGTDKIEKEKERKNKIQKK